MFSNKLYTPLRYPGGKARFAPYIARLIRENGLEGGHYMEPYAGGAGVALELLFDGVVTDVHINDADAAVSDFWRAATRHGHKLMHLVDSEPVTMEAWHHWREVMLGKVRAPLVERGFATLFLNRTNRSGILKGGVIGGKEQCGEYKLNARYKPDALLTRLERIRKHAKHIHVYSEDAFHLLSRCVDVTPPRTLIYLDPPYYLKGQGLYRNFYTHADHLAIAKLVQSSKFARPWLVTYDDTPEIREMYTRSRRVGYGLHYTAQSRYIGSEVMFFGRRIATGRRSPIAA